MYNVFVIKTIILLDGLHLSDSAIIPRAGSQLAHKNSKFYIDVVLLGASKPKLSTPVDLINSCLYTMFND